MEHAEHLKTDLPQDAELHFTGARDDDGARHVCLSLPGVFDLSARVHVTRPTVEWDSARVYGSSEAKGVWSTFARNLIAVSYAAGRHTILGYALWETGGYAMARGRFLPFGDAWPRLRDRSIAPRLDAFAPVLEKHGGAQAVARVRDIMASDAPESLWDLADVDFDYSPALDDLGSLRCDEKFYRTFHAVDGERGFQMRLPRMLPGMLASSPRRTLGYMLLMRTSYAAQMKISQAAYMHTLLGRYKGLDAMVSRLTA